MTRQTLRNVVTEISAIIAVFYVLMSANVFFALGGIGSGPLESQAIGALLLLLATVLIVGGIFVIRSSTTLGLALILIGAVPPAVQMYWILFTPVIWALVLVVLLLRVTRYARDRRTERTG